MKKPNFFIIGAPKCGTTALSEYLREHPQVFFSDPKELYFFNEDFANRRTTSLEDYLHYFEEAKESHKAVGEGSVFYLRSKVAVQKILAFQPEARLIVMFRNPVDLAYSLHAEILWSDQETEPDFERAWRLKDERKLGQHIPQACGDPKVLMYDDLCMLGEQLEQLYRTVPSDRVKLIDFDDFRSETKRIYEEVLDFLELDSDGRTSFAPVNTNKAYKSLWLDLARRQASGWWQGVRRGLGIEVKLGINSRLKRTNAVRKKRPPLSPSFRAELKSFFRDDVRKLSELTGRDLSHWVE